MAVASTTRRVALMLLPEGRRYRRVMYRRFRTGPAIPFMDPELTIRQVRQQAQRALPGATVTRLVLPRYELRWRKPREWSGGDAKRASNQSGERGVLEGETRPVFREETL